MRSRIIEAVGIIVGLAVAVRVVWALLQPLLPALLLILLLGGFLLWATRGPGQVLNAL